MKSVDLLSQNLGFINVQIWGSNWNQWRCQRSRVQVCCRVWDTLQVGIAFCVLKLFIKKLYCFKAFFGGYLSSNLPAGATEGLYPSYAFSIDSSKTNLHITRRIFAKSVDLLSQNLGFINVQIWGSNWNPVAVPEVPGSSML